MNKPNGTNQSKTVTQQATADEYELANPTRTEYPGYALHACLHTCLLRKGMQLYLTKNSRYSGHFVASDAYVSGVPRITSGPLKLTCTGCCSFPPSDRLADCFIRSHGANNKCAFCASLPMFMNAASGLYCTTQSLQ